MQGVLTPKGQATRARIVEGAAEVVRDLGVAMATLDDIRARTGTSKSQLFHYFPGGKDALLLAVAQYEAGRVLEVQQPHLGRLDSWDAWYRWRDTVVERYELQGDFCPGSAVSLRIPRHRVPDADSNRARLPGTGPAPRPGAPEGVPDEGLTQQPSTRRPVSAGDRLVTA
jgi:AcrR family transcriptional regulator